MSTAKRFAFAAVGVILGTLVLIATDRHSAPTLALRLGEAQLLRAAASDEWRALEPDERLEEGDHVRAVDRSVIAAEDGSEIRLEAGTEIEIQEVTKKFVWYDLEDGRAYNIITPNEQRTWSVQAFSVKATALGTKFAVACDSANEKVGIEVVENKVRVAAEAEDGSYTTELDENELMYIDLQKGILDGVGVGDITDDQIAADPFLSWNPTGQTAIAVSTELVETPIPVVEAPTTAPAPVVKPKPITTPKPKNETALVSAPIPTELSLKAAKTEDGILLTWTPSTSKEFKGYKVVRSDWDANLAYPQAGYISFITDPSVTRYVDAKAAAGNTYYYRICALTNDGAVSCGNVAQIQN
jgi:hypothetical protein